MLRGDRVNLLGERTILFLPNLFAYAWLKLIALSAINKHEFVRVWSKRTARFHNL